MFTGNVMKTSANKLAIACMLVATALALSTGPALSQIAMDTQAATVSDQIAAIRVFPDPVVPAIPAGGPEGPEVLALIRNYQLQQDVVALDLLTSWSETHLASPWSPSLLFNAGGAYY